MKKDISGNWYKDRVVLVTGASSGIGREIVFKLVQYGSTVLPCGRNNQEMKQLGDELSRMSSHPRDMFIADFSDMKSFDKLLAKLKKLKIDIVVNCAGSGYIGAFDAMASEDIDALLQVNVFSLISLCRLMIPRMKQHRFGGILNVGSVASFFPTPGSSLYCASKYSVLGFTDSLHCELLSYGIHVTGVYPGNTHSRFISRATGGKVEKWSRAMSPEVVAIESLKGLRMNKLRVIPGLKNKLLVCIAKTIPTSLLLGIKAG